MFTIGPMCAINRISSEPPEDRDRAEWSVKGCPFLSKPQMKRRVDDFIEKGQRRHSPAGNDAIERNPGVTMIWTTLSFSIIRDPNGKPLFQIGEPEHIPFWREGRRAAGWRYLKVSTPDRHCFKKFAVPETNCRI